MVPFFKIMLLCNIRTSLNGCDEPELKDTNSKEMNIETIYFIRNSTQKCSVTASTSISLFISTHQVSYPPPSPPIFSGILHNLKKNPFYCPDNGIIWDYQLVGRSSSAEASKQLLKHCKEKAPCLLYFRLKLKFCLF